MAMAMKLAVVLLVVLVALQAAQASKEYQVNWDFPPTDKFFSAIQQKVYHVGDTLVFNYGEGMHNVVKVESVEDFNHCTTFTKVGDEHDDGMTSLTLDKAGAHYFICSYPGHCTDGMKIKVLVQHNA